MTRKKELTINPQRELLLMTLREKFAYMIVGVLVISFFTIGGYSLVTRSPMAKVLGETFKNTHKKAPATIAQKQEKPLQTYVVQPGNSLSSISMTKYGSTDYADKIAQANNLDPLAFLTEGQKLVLPNITVSTTPTPTYTESPTETPTPTLTPTPTASPTPTQVTSKDNGKITEEAAKTKQVKTKNKGEYTVQEGESLWDVAEKVYGDGKEWERIVKENKIANPNSVAAGTKLKTPRK